MAAQQKCDGEVRIIPIPALPLFAAGDDLAEAIGAALRRAGLELADDDVVVVAQKIVSKAEGRTMRLATVEVGTEARALAAEAAKDPAVMQLVLNESRQIMRVKRGVVIARHRLGHVAANAGIDASNIPHDQGDSVLLWPSEPDASAARLRERLEAQSGRRLAVVISDSLGRAWRTGTVGTAIGVSGLDALLDRCGEVDLFGRVLRATVIGRADELAAAASLVIGEAAEGTPVAIIRGARYRRDEHGSIGPILRPIEEDLFP